MSHRLEDIKAELQRRVRELAQDVITGADAHFAGNYRIGRNPTRADGHGGSFWILVRGSVPGIWKDEATGDTGDVVDLVGYWRGCWKDRSATRAECLKWLGWGNGANGAKPLSAAEIAERDRQREQQRAREEADAETERAEKRNQAFALWLKAEKLDEGRFAGSVLDRYFRSRGIDLVAGVVDAGRKLPGAIRFLAEHDYTTRDGELLSLPCMIVLLTGPDGKPRAVHRTWLQPDGSGKARLPEGNAARKIWPAGWQGGVARIAKGEGEHTPEEAARRGLAGPLIVTEGIEDALAIMLALPGRRVWAAGTLGNIGHVPLLPCVSQVTVFADNDWDKPQATQALERAIAALRQHGKPVYTARAPGRFKDANDVLKGERV